MRESTHIQFPQAHRNVDPKWSRNVLFLCLELDDIQILTFFFQSFDSFVDCFHEYWY